MVILVTGAGSGIGRAIAQVLARAGHCVYASMRLNGEHGPVQAENARQFAAHEGLDVRVIELDVLSEASCRAAVDQVLGEQGMDRTATLLRVGPAVPVHERRRSSRNGASHERCPKQPAGHRRHICPAGAGCVVRAGAHVPRQTQEALIGFRGGEARIRKLGCEHLVREQRREQLTGSCEELVLWRHPS